MRWFESTLVTTQMSALLTVLVFVGSLQLATANPVENDDEQSVTEHTVNLPVYMSVPTIPDAIWNTFAGALFGGLFASGVVAFITQRLTETRERRNRRDQLCLELYLEVVDLVLDNQVAIAERGVEGSIPPVELQTKRFRISHRLKLLGSKEVQAAFKSYSQLVFQETAHPVEYRPRNPDDVTQAREQLIESMRKHVQDS